MTASGLGRLHRTSEPVVGAVPKRWASSGASFRSAVAVRDLERDERNDGRLAEVRCASSRGVGAAHTTVDLTRP